MSNFTKCGCAAGRVTNRSAETFDLLSPTHPRTHAPTHPRTHPPTHPPTHRCPESLAALKAGGHHRNLGAEALEAAAPALSSFCVCAKLAGNISGPLWDALAKIANQSFSATAGRAVKLIPYAYEIRQSNHHSEFAYDTVVVTNHDTGQVALSRSFQAGAGSSLPPRERSAVTTDGRPLLDWPGAPPLLVRLRFRGGSLGAIHHPT